MHRCLRGMETCTVNGSWNGVEQWTEQDSPANELLLCYLLEKSCSCLPFGGAEFPHPVGGLDADNLCESQTLNSL